MLGTAVADEKKLVAIDIKLEGAAARFDLALRQFREMEEAERLDKEKAARDPTYKPLLVSPYYSSKLSAIKRKYTALEDIDTLLVARMKEGESLSKREQLAFVQEQLRRARDRRERDPNGATLQTVTMLMKKESELRAGEKKRR